MISVILSIISGIFSAAGKLFDFFYAQKLIDAGKTAQQVSDLKAQVDAAHLALQAKAAIDADIAANGERVPIDDPFLRD